MTKTCPICKKNETILSFKPFCSKRCADIDLLKWLKGDYHFEAQEGLTSGEAEPAQPNAPHLL